MAPHARAAHASVLGERFDYPPQWDKTKNADASRRSASTLLGSMRPALLATFVAMAAHPPHRLRQRRRADARPGEAPRRRSWRCAPRWARTARRLTQQLVVEALCSGSSPASSARASPRRASACSPARCRSARGARARRSTGRCSAPRWRSPSRAVAARRARPDDLALARRPARRDEQRAHRRRSGRGGRLERGLVVAEVALAMLIASGAALLVRSVVNLYAIDPGIETARRRGDRRRRRARR